MNIDFTHLSNADLMRMKIAHSAINNHAYISNLGRVGKFLADAVWGKGAQKHYDNWKELSGADFPHIANKSGKEWFDFVFSHNMGLRGLFSQEHRILRESDIPTYIKSDILLRDKDVSFEARKVLEYGLNRGLTMERATGIVAGEHLDDDHIMKNVVQQLSELGLSAFGTASDIEYILEGLHNSRRDEPKAADVDRSPVMGFGKDNVTEPQLAQEAEERLPLENSAKQPELKTVGTAVTSLNDLIRDAESKRTKPEKSASIPTRETGMER